MPFVAKKLENVSEQVPQQITNVEDKIEYKKLGTIEKMEVAKVVKKEDSN
jgi:hypothetical protein